jgi:hypothetical protein
MRWQCPVGTVGCCLARHGSWFKGSSLGGMAWTCGDVGASTPRAAGKWVIGTLGDGGNCGVGTLGDVGNCMLCVGGVRLGTAVAKICAS